ncbi:MAG: type IV secretion system protein, partial [Steroidobacteraceae bacterium]|nr:type IV secretion system protein [Steroidobacteraceae bacterium]
MLFTTFWQWLTVTLNAYVAQNVVAMAQAIEPTAVTLAVVYVMVWGFLQMKGSVQEPVLSGVLRIVRLAVVFGIGLRLWQYNALLVDTFMDAPV